MRTFRVKIYAAARACFSVCGGIQKFLRVLRAPVAEPPLSKFLNPPLVIHLSVMPWVVHYGISVLASNRVLVCICLGSCL